MHFKSAILLAGIHTALAEFSSGGLSILAPGGSDLWWLTGQINNLVWTCGESTHPDFTIWMNNSNVNLLTDITAIVAVEQNYNCIQGVPADLVVAPPGDGYTLVLTSSTNATDVYAVSKEFSIKPLSAGYPASSATPVDTASATVAKGTASNVLATSTGGAAPGASSSSSHSGAMGLKPVGVLAGLMALAVGSML